MYMVTCLRGPATGFRCSQFSFIYKYFQISASLLDYLLVTEGFAFPFRAFRTENIYKPAHQNHFSIRPGADVLDIYPAYLADTFPGSVAGCFAGSSLDRYDLNYHTWVDGMPNPERLWIVSGRSLYSMDFGCSIPLYPLCVS